MAHKRFDAPRLYLLPADGTQTPNHANSTSPSSASLSNTVAGYTTCGGRYQFAAPAGAATDFALFGYQMPATHRGIITGVDISAVNTGATVATNPTILDWFMQINGDNVSLADADARRLPLGMQGFIVGALAGTVAQEIRRSFHTPLIIEPSRFLHVGVQVPVGTATGSQVIRGDVHLNGYFEAI